MATRWGMLGCGSVTDSKSAPAYQQTEHFELTAVCARTPGKAQAYAEQRNIPKHYTNAQDLINDKDIDAVYIATPPDSHLELALMVAEAGKMCCVEKPMAVNYAECAQMLSAFEQADLPLFVAYYRRCLPGFVQIKQWLEQNLIGKVRHVDWQYFRTPSELDLSGKYNWRTDSKIAPGGYFDDLASHGLNVMTFLLGDVADAKGFATNQQGLYSAYDAITANLFFESGVTGTGAWNFACSERQDKVEISGSQGSISFGIFTEIPAKLVNTSGTQVCEMPKPTPIQGPLVRAMAKHIAGESAHPSMADSAAHTNWIMDKILRPSI